MKAKLFLIALAVLSCYLTKADIIPNNSHHVKKCVKITNIEDFDNLILLGFIDMVNGDSQIYTITSENCLTKAYKFNGLNIYGVNKNYYNTLNNSVISYSTNSNFLETNVAIKPYGGYVHDSIPIDSIFAYYRIMGFTEKEVIIHKFKEITKYNIDSVDTVEEFEYEGDSTMLMQMIPLGFKLEKQKEISLYPNPANDQLNIKIHNNISSNCKVFSISGQLVKSFSFTSTSYTLDTKELRAGTYFMQIQTDNSIETRKILICHD